jgi:hypothetical protein
MHDAKRALHDAEKLLESNSTQGVRALIDKAALIMKRVAPDSRTNWARIHYEKAIDVLMERLVPLEKRDEEEIDELLGRRDPREINQVGPSRDSGTGP